MRLETIIAATLSGLVALSTPSFLNSQTPQQKVEAELKHEEKMYQEALGQFDFRRRLNIGPFLDIVSRFPESRNAHFLEGNLLFYVPIHKKYERAIDAYSKALWIDDQFGPAYVNRAVAWIFRAAENREQGLTGELDADTKDMLETALKSLRTAEIVAPKLFAVHYNKAHVCTLLGLEPIALQHYNKAVDLAPKVRKDMPTMAGEHSKERVFGPTCLVSSFLSHATDITSYYIQGQQIVRYGDLQYISNENDNQAFACFYQGLCYASKRIKYFDGALSSLSEAIKLNPNVPDFYFFRGLVHQTDGRKKEAADDIAQGANLARRIQSMIKPSER